MEANCAHLDIENLCRIIEETESLQDLALLAEIMVEILHIPPCDRKSLRHMVFQRMKVLSEEAAAPIEFAMIKLVHGGTDSQRHPVA